MLKIQALIISIFLIVIIFVRIPQESMGLSDSSTSVQRFLNIVTSIGILIYFGIAVQLNLAKN